MNKVLSFGANVIKLFTTVSYNFCNKLEQSSLSRILWCLQVRQEPTQVKQISDSPLKGSQILALAINIRPDWKVFQGANTLDYYKNS